MYQIGLIVRIGQIQNYGRNEVKEKIKNILENNFKKSKILVSGDESKFVVEITSNEFLNKSTIERHKMIYALLNDFISSGEIHALTIKSKTFDE